MNISKKLVWVGLLAYPFTAAAGGSSPSACGIDASLNYGSNVYLLSLDRNLLTFNTPIVPSTPLCTGTELPTYSLTNQANTKAVSLIQDLTFTGAEGVISGDPTASLAETWYTTTLSDGGFTYWQGLSLEVLSQTALNYKSSYAFACGTAIAAIKPADTTGLGVSSYSISCVNSSGGSVPLAGGLAFSATTGEITGTPTQVVSEKCTVTANNGSESVAQEFSVGVNAISPTTFAASAARTVYNGVPVDFNSLSNISCITPSYTYSISPTTLNGLNFNSATGEVSGIPDTTFTGTKVSSATTYTITVSGTGKAKAPTFTLAMTFDKSTATTLKLPKLAYPGIAFAVGYPAALAPSSTEPTATNATYAYQIAQGSTPNCSAAGYNGSSGSYSTSVPIGSTGLTFNQLTGAISGTPTGIFNADYTVAECTTSATNTSAATINLQANEITQIAAGQSHTCAIINGGAWCWGQNSSGQSGGNTSYPNSANGAVFQVLGISGTVTKIAAGDNHTCAIAGGAAYCWGLNTSYQLGTGQSGGSYSTASMVSLPGTVTDIAAGGSHTCAVVGGSAYCWGANQSGQVGQPIHDTVNEGNILTPTEVSLQLGSGASVSNIAAGEMHTCATDTNGRIWCWGDNTYGELGNGSGMNGAQGVESSITGTPVQVTGVGGKAMSISAAGAHTCAIVNNPANIFQVAPSNSNIFTECWGDNSSAWIPPSLNSAGKVIALFEGSELGTQCADTTYKATGLSPVTAPCPYSATAAPVYGFWGISNSPTAISMGWATGCEIFNGHAACWGSNEAVSPVSSNGPISYGLLGDGTTTVAANARAFANSSSNPVPVSVTGSANAVSAIAAGADHACAIVSGKLQCWGDDGIGQLGINPCSLGGSCTATGVLKAGVTKYETTPVSFDIILPAGATATPSKAMLRVSTPAGTVVTGGGDTGITTDTDTATEDSTNAE